jgi:hypothetical protein
LFQNDLDGEREEEGMKMDLYFIGISFPHLILFDIDKFSEFSGEGNVEILRETIFD